MTSRDDQDWPAGLRAALRRQAEHPPAMTPEEAARRVRTRLSPRTRPRVRQWLVPVAAAAAVIVALASAGRLAEEPAPAPRPRLTEHHPVVVGPLPDNIVLWWADPETPVYFILPEAGTKTGGQS
jgi:hypothetical protein